MDSRSSLNYRFSWWASIASVAIVVFQSSTQDQANRPYDRAWVEKLVADWQPTKEERAFDEIGWAKDLREARRLAAEHDRPIFLFTYDGESLASYRC